MVPVGADDRVDEVVEPAVGAALRCRESFARADARQRGPSMPGSPRTGRPAPTAPCDRTGRPSSRGTRRPARRATGFGELDLEQRAEGELRVRAVRVELLDPVALDAQPLHSAKPLRVPGLGEQRAEHDRARSRTAASRPGRATGRAASRRSGSGARIDGYPCPQHPHDERNEHARKRDQAPYGRARPDAGVPYLLLPPGPPQGRIGLSLSLSACCGATLKRK